jgi:hypothetical protein
MCRSSSSSSSSELTSSELPISENECYRNDLRRDAFECAVNRAQSLAQFAVALHQQRLGAAAAAGTTNSMLWLVSIAPCALVLSFAIKLSQLPPVLSVTTTPEDAADIVRRHVAALDKDDRILAVLAASLVGDDAAVVFDVLLTACGWLSSSSQLPIEWKSEDLCSCVGV